MSTRVVSESLGSNLEMNNLNTCTSANREAHAKAAASIKKILATEFRVSGPGATSSGGAVRVFPEFPLLVPFIVLLPLSVSALAY